MIIFSHLVCHFPVSFQLPALLRYCGCMDTELCRDYFLHDTLWVGCNDDKDFALGHCVSPIHSYLNENILQDSHHPIRWRNVFLTVKFHAKSSPNHRRKFGFGIAKIFFVLIIVSSWVMDLALMSYFIRLCWMCPVFIMWYQIRIGSQNPFTLFW